MAAIGLRKGPVFRVRPSHDSRASVGRRCVRVARACRPMWRCITRSRSRVEWRFAHAGQCVECGVARRVAQSSSRLCLACVGARSSTGMATASPRIRHVSLSRLRRVASGSDSLVSAHCSLARGSVQTDSRVWGLGSTGGLSLSLSRLPPLSPYSDSVLRSPHTSVSPEDYAESENGGNFPNASRVVLVEAQAGTLRRAETNEKLLRRERR